MENKLAKSLAYWIDLTPDKNWSFKVRNQKCGGLDFSPENWSAAERAAKIGLDTQAIRTVFV